MVFLLARHWLFSSSSNVFRLSFFYGFFFPNISLCNFFHLQIASSVFFYITRFIEIGLIIIIKYIHIYIIILIILCHQHGYPWPFLATPPYRSSSPAGPQGYTPYPHRAAVCRLELVALLLLGHVKGSIGVHHLWAHPNNIYIYIYIYIYIWCSGSIVI